MNSIQKYLLFTVIVLLSASRTFAGDLKTWNYVDENGAPGTLAIYDKSRVTGEEMVTWTRPSGDQDMAKPTTINATNVEVQFFTQGQNGDVLMDMNLGISFGESYQQTLALLSDKKFRDSFRYLPENCSEQDQGFVIIMDNVVGEMTGYCLAPAK